MCRCRPKTRSCTGCKAGGHFGCQRTCILYPQRIDGSANEFAFGFWQSHSGSSAEKWRAKAVEPECSVLAFDVGGRGAQSGVLHLPHEKKQYREPLPRERQRKPL